MFWWYGWIGPFSHGQSKLCNISWSYDIFDCTLPAVHLVGPPNLSPLKSSLLRASLDCRRGALSHQSLSCMTWNTSGKAFSTITLWPSFATLGVMLEGIACNCGGCWTWGGWIRWRGSTASDTLSWGWPILGEYSIWYASHTSTVYCVAHVHYKRLMYLLTGMASPASFWWTHTWPTKPNTTLQPCNGSPLPWNFIIWC